MGVSEFSGISYNLSELLTPMDLDGLDADLNNEEIEVVIKSIPNSHAPSPDGFNGLFIKKCWNIVKDDFVRLFRDFCTRNTNLTSINSYVIALIPKKENLGTVNDFRPISLLNYSLKCMTKILSSRL
jgi:hypothetical protein